jgi:hypothetical protein
VESCPPENSTSAVSGLIVMLVVMANDYNISGARESADGLQF